MLLTKNKTAASIFKGLKLLWRIMLHLGAILFWIAVIFFWAAVHFREEFQETPVNTADLVHGYYAAETKNSSFLELRDSDGTTKTDKIKYLCADGNHIHGEIYEGRYFVFNAKKRDMYKSPETNGAIKNFTEYLLILKDEDIPLCTNGNIVKSLYVRNEEEKR